MIIGRLIAAALLCAAASATTIIPMSIERLTRASTDVVVAHEEDSWSEWNREQTVIYTVTRFRVQQAWKGDGRETVTVRQMGGRIGNILQKVAGVRHWGSGEEAVLFLRPSKQRDGTFAITGLMQGDFRLRRQGQETVVSNGAPNVETFEPGSRRIGRYRGSRLRLADLERAVKKAAQQ